MSYNDYSTKLASAKSDERIWLINAVDNSMNNCLSNHLREALLKYCDDGQMTELVEKMNPEIKRFITAAINSALEIKKMGRINREEIKKTDFLGSL